MRYPHLVERQTVQTVHTPMARFASDQQRQAMAKNILLGRIGRPDDLKRLFLASHSASFITGATLPGSGGTA